MPRTKRYIYFEGKLTVPPDDIDFNMQYLNAVMNNIVSEMNKNYRIRCRRHCSPDSSLKKL